MKPARLRNTLRERVATWASREHPAELRANVRRFLGKPPETEAEARSALPFALVTAAEGGSLIDRFVAHAGHFPRAERPLIDEWARARFGLLRIVAVTPGESVDVHDVLADRELRIVERSGSAQMEAGMWLAAFVYDDGGSWAFEGALSVVAPHRRLHGVRAGLAAYAAMNVAPGEANPGQSRRVANAVYDAMNLAPAPAPVELPDDEFRRLNAAWPDTPLAELGDRTPRQALAEGRRAEVWALAASPDEVPWPSAEALLG